jgi:hypothetical protein
MGKWYTYETPTRNEVDRAIGDLKEYKVPVDDNTYDESIKYGELRL